MSTRRYYSTDLTEAQWALLLTLLPARKWRPGGPGRPPCDRRRVINGILYLLKTGCQWRMLPREFGKWSTIYAYLAQNQQLTVVANSFSASLEVMHTAEPRSVNGGLLTESGGETITPT